MSPDVPSQGAEVHKAEVLNNLRTNAALGEEVDTGKFFGDILEAERVGLTKDPKCSQFLQVAGEDPVIREALYFRLKRNIALQESEDIQQDLHLASLYGMDQKPENPNYEPFYKFIIQTQKEYGPITETEKDEALDFIKQGEGASSLEEYEELYHAIKDKVVSWPDEDLAQLPPYVLLALISQGDLKPSQIKSLPEDKDAVDKNNQILKGSNLNDLIYSGKDNEEVAKMALAALKEAYQITSMYIPDFNPGKPINADDLYNAIHSTRQALIDSEPYVYRRENWQDKIPLLGSKSRSDREAKIAELEQAEDELSRARNLIDIAQAEKEIYKQLITPPEPEKEVTSPTAVQPADAHSGNGPDRTTETAASSTGRVPTDGLLERDPEQLSQQIEEGRLAMGEIAQLNIPPRIQELMAGYLNKDTGDQAGPLGRVSIQNVRKYMKEWLDKGVSEDELTQALPGMAVAAFAEACRRITQRFPEARDQHFTPEQLIEFASQKRQEIERTIPSSNSRNYSKEEEERIRQDSRSIIHMWQLVWYSNILSDLHNHLKNGEGEFSLTGNYSLTKLHDYDHPIPAEFADWLPEWLESMKTQAEGMTTEQLVDIYIKYPYSLARLLTDGMLTPIQIKSLEESEVFWAFGDDAKNRQTSAQKEMQSLHSDAKSKYRLELGSPPVDEFFDQWLKNEQQQGKFVTRFQLAQLAALFLISGFNEIRVAVSNQNYNFREYEHYRAMPFFAGDARQELHIGFESATKALQTMDIKKSTKRDAELSLEMGRLALTMVDKGEYDGTTT